MDRHNYRAAELSARPLAPQTKTEQSGARRRVERRRMELRPREGLGTEKSGCRADGRSWRIGSGGCGGGREAAGFSSDIAGLAPSELGY